MRIQTFLLALLACALASPAVAQTSIDATKTGQAILPSGVAVPGPGFNRGIDACDDFNRASGTNMGPNWTEVQGDFGITANTGYAISTSNQYMIENNAVAGFAGSDMQVDFLPKVSGSNLIYVALISGYADLGNNVFIKVQDNNSDGLYDRVFFYGGINGSPWNIGSYFFDLATPTASGRMDVYFTGGGDVANLDIHNHTSGMVEHFESSGLLASGFIFGTQFGIGAFNSPAFDNYEVNGGCGGGGPGNVLVIAEGTDNFVDPEFHVIENNGGIGIDAVTLDISVIPGAFWDFDGAASFANALSPVLAPSTTYGGTVTWTYGPLYPNDPILTANFAPPLPPGQMIVFGADTDFFVSDPCPGSAFGAAPATMTAAFSGGTGCSAPYFTLSPVRSEASCGGGAGYVLSIVNLVAGAVTTLTTTGGTPGGPTFFAYSVAGGGPTAIVAGPCGPVTVDLSPPFTQLGPIPADPGGTATLSVGVPPGTSGVTVWAQAFDLASCTLSNGLMEVIG